MDLFLPYCGRLENKNEEIAALNRAQRQKRRPSKVEWDKRIFQKRSTGLKERIHCKLKSKEKNTWAGAWNDLT
jgi:hypothetical protein